MTPPPWSGFYQRTFSFAQRIPCWWWLSLIRRRAKRRDDCVAKNATLRAARPDPSRRKKRLLGMTIKLSHYHRASALDERDIRRRCIPAALAGTNRDSAQGQLALSLTSLEGLESLPRCRFRWACVD